MIYSVLSFFGLITRKSHVSKIEAIKDEYHKKRMADANRLKEIYDNGLCKAWREADEFLKCYCKSTFEESPDGKYYVRVEVCRNMLYLLRRESNSMNVLLDSVIRNIKVNLRKTLSDR